MTPRRLDPEVVEARLRLMREALEDLDAVGEVNADRLETDRLALRVVERCLSHLVDLATDINAHVAAARLQSAPRDLTESFDLAAHAGLISAELARELRGSAGLRNVIIHVYGRLDTRRLAEVVPDAVRGYRRYVRQAAQFLTAFDDEREP